MLHSCSSHSNLEIEVESLKKNLSYLNLNISRTKNGKNKLQKLIEQGRVIELTDCCHFTQKTEKNLQFPFKNGQFLTFTIFFLHL